MTVGNGVLAKLDYLAEEVKRLRESRASKESVENVQGDIHEIRDGMKELRGAFRNLQTAILVACVTWALGSAGFIIGVLALAGK